MDLIDTIKPQLSTALSSSAVENPWQHQKTLGMPGIEPGTLCVKREPYLCAIPVTPRWSKLTSAILGRSLLGGADLDRPVPDEEPEMLRRLGAGLELGRHRDRVGGNRFKSENRLKGSVAWKHFLISSGPCYKHRFKMRRCLCFWCYWDLYVKSFLLTAHWLHR